MPREAPSALEPHILEMAVAIEAERRVRDYRHTLEEADLEAREVSSEWISNPRRRGDLAFDLAVRQALACWEAVQKNAGAVARLAERDALSYVIRMEPGRKITMRSLGRQLAGLSTLLTAEAKAVGKAQLTCFVNDIEYDKQANEIRLALSLVHTMPGVVPSAEHEDPNG